MSQKENHRRNLLSYAFVVLSSCIVFFRWINFSIQTYSDYRYADAKTLKEYLIPSAWTTLRNIGEFNIFLWKYPLHIIYGVIGSMGYGMEYADKIITIFPIVILLPFISFFVLLKFTKSRLAAFVGMSVFVYNSYFLAISTQGHLLLILPACFMLLGLYSYTRIHNNIHHTKKRIIYNIFCTFLIGLIDLRMLYIQLITYLLFSVFTCVIQKKISISICKMHFSNLGTIVVALFLLNSYWLIPAINFSSYAQSQILNRQLFGSQFFNINRSISLFHPFWTGTSANWFMTQEMPWRFFLYPFFAFLGLLTNRNNKTVVFFALLAAIGVFLSKQIAPPFGFIYEILFRYFPGFSMFREASKFYVLIVLGYSTLTAFFIAWLQKQNHNKIILSIVTTCLLVLSLYNIYPLISGSIGTMYKTINVHNDYKVINTFLNGQKGYFRVLSIPRASQFIGTNSNHPVISFDELIYKYLGLFHAENYRNSILDDKLINTVLKSKDLTEILSKLSIRYLVLPVRTQENEEIYQIYNMEQRLLRSILDRQSGLIPVSLKTNELLIYENMKYNPHFFLSSDEKGNQRAVGQIQVMNLSPYFYKVTAQKGLYYLHFNETYSQGWLLISYPYFRQQFHIKSRLHTNIFRIMPNQEHNVFYLLYLPQLYFYIGMIISCVSLALFIRIIYVKHEKK